MVSAQFLFHAKKQSLSTFHQIYVSFLWDNLLIYDV